jgi:hypothetical protein
MFTRRVNVFASLPLLVAAAQLAWSQESRGTILGRVTDTSGSVVSGANVQVANKATGVTVPGTSNEDGNYFFPYLIPGIYQITVEKAGFKRAVRDGIQVNINDRLEINIGLELGAVNESVEVTTQAPLLTTTDASAGRTMDFRDIKELPILHGDPDNIIGLAPNVSFTDQMTKDQPWQSLNTAYASIGSRQSRLEFTLDGQSNTAHDVLRNSVIEAWTPTGDSVAEMKVQTLTFDVTVGQTEGMVLNYTTKSGANQPHGSFYWGKQFPSWNANQFFSNLAGTPAAGFNYQRLGGIMDGPVWIPKVYNGKNRTFFTFAYEHIQSNTDLSSILTVPTAAERGGDFSALLALGSSYQIYDPYSRVPTSTPGIYSNTPLPGNIVPASKINPISTAILGYIPMPDTVQSVATKDGGNNVNRTNWPSYIPYHTELYRFDEVLNDKTRVMFRADANRRNSLDSDYMGHGDPATGSLFWNDTIGFDADAVHTFSSTFVLDVRLADQGYVRAQHALTGQGTFQLTSLGFPASIQNNISPSNWEFPTMVFQNGTATSYPNGLTGSAEYTMTGPRTPLFKNTQTRDLNVQLDKIHGQHDFKFGAEFRGYPDNQTSANGSPTQATGHTLFELDFNDAFTVGPTSTSAAAPRGQSMAAFLYGLPTTGVLQTPFTTDFADSSNVWAGFFQDNWKATRKLTLNIGLRYERESAMWERYNRSATGFNPNTVQPFAAQVEANYAANPLPQLPASQFNVNGALQFAGVSGNSKYLYNPYDKEIEPRLGFAYNLDDKTVVRGGWGTYYGTIGTKMNDAWQYGFFQNTQVVPTLDGGQTFVSSISNPFPNGFIQPTGPTASAGLGNPINFFNQNPKPNRMRKLTIDIQRQLGTSWLVDIGTAGENGGNLEVGNNPGSNTQPTARLLSALPDKYLSTSPVRDQTTINALTAQVPNPFNIPTFNGTSLAGSVIQAQQLLQPYPQFASVGYYTYDGRSWYNSLEATLTKRFSDNFSVVAGYTFSKFLEDTTLLNAGDPLPSKVISDVDSPHHITISGIYELPFGKGRKWGTHLPTVLDYVVSGWQFSPIYRFQSGFPIYIPDLILTNGNEKAVPLPPNQRSEYRWFNTSAFNNVPSQQLADNLRTLSLRFGNFRQDCYNYWDASMLKETRIHENYLVQFRFEAINVLNQVDLSPPSMTVGTTFGQITAQNNVPRQMQFTLRFAF